MAGNASFACVSVRATSFGVSLPIVLLYLKLYLSLFDLKLQLRAQLRASASPGPGAGALRDMGRRVGTDLEPSFQLKKYTQYIAPNQPDGKKSERPGQTCFAWMQEKRRTVRAQK